MGIFSFVLKYWKVLPIFAVVIYIGVSGYFILTYKNKYDTVKKENTYLNQIINKYKVNNKDTQAKIERLKKLAEETRVVYKEKKVKDMDFCNQLIEERFDTQEEDNGTVEKDNNTDSTINSLNRLLRIK